MPYTSLSLSAVWLLALFAMALSLSGEVTGLGLAALVLMTALMPTAVMRLVPVTVARRARRDGEAPRQA